MHRQIKFSIWFPIVLVAAFAAGYLFWQKTLIPGSYDTEPVNLVGNGGNNQLEGWQTYRNDKYGFEMKYPSTHLAKEYPKNETRSFFSVCFQNSNSAGVACLEPRIVVDVYDNLNNNEPEKYARAVYKQSEKILVDKYSAIKFTDHEELAPQEYVIIKGYNNLFVIYSDVQIFPNKISLDQILSTFRFID